MSLRRFLDVCCTVVLGVISLSYIFVFRVLTRKQCFVIHASRLGHLAAEMNLHVLQHENSTDRYFYRTPIANSAFFKIATAGLDVVPLGINDYGLRLAGKLGLRRHFFSEITDCNDRDVCLKRNNSPNPITLSADEHMKCKDAFVRNGCEKLFDQPIVLLNVRDSTYLSSEFSDKDYAYHNFRDSAIDTYADAVRALLANDFSVVRVGKLTERSLDINSEYFLDYSKSHLRTDMHDIFLAESAFSCVSTGSGFDALTTINKVPTLYLNYLPHGYCMLFSPRDMTVFKKLRKVNDGASVLSLREIYELGAFTFMSEQDYVSGGLEIQDLSSDEIRRAVTYFFNLSDGSCADKDMLVTQDLTTQFFRIVKSDLRLSSLFAAEPHGRVIGFHDSKL